MNSSPTTRGMILLYHRVAEVRSDPWALAVTPRHFQEHLEVLTSTGVIVGLEQLQEAALSGPQNERTFAVTFDDGYLDVLDTAKPILERHEAPATVFVPTGMMGSRREFWWDELERVVLHSATLPRELWLSVGGREYRWNLGDAAHAAVGDLYPGWRAWGQPDPTERHYLFRSLYELLYGLSEAERLPIQDQLLGWAGAPLEPEHIERRVISDDELAVLAAGELMTIGAHTVTHSLLAQARADAQWFEITESKRHLENVLGHPLSSFAYPFGKHGDFTEKTVALVRKAGFSSACANFPGTIDPHADPYQLPRMYVFDWDGDEFARQLEAWFAA